MHEELYCLQVAMKVWVEVKGGSSGPRPDELNALGVSQGLAVGNGLSSYVTAIPAASISV